MVLARSPIVAAASTTPLFVWIGVLGLLVIFGAVALMHLRRKLIDHPDAPSNNRMPFTLDQLRRMHRDGTLSDEEFDKAKAQLLLKVGGSPLKPPAPPVQPEKEKPTDPPTQT